MSNYIRFSIAFVLTGILLIVICNIYLIGTNGDDNSRQYLVDIKRAADEIRAGADVTEIDMLREKLEDDKAREMELVKEKKTLIMSLSHDIKTPLAAIDLYTKALAQNIYDTEEKRNEAVSGIVNNVAEIKKYVNEIANASREDFLAIEVNNREFYLHEVMNSISLYYTEKMKLNHTEFVIDNVTDCLIYGDVDRTVEVLQNVLENAIKYGDGKSVRITFDEEEDCKLVTVINSGCKLAEEECTNIFDSFYRGSNSANVNGSGLGLYICKEILRKMDGDIFAKILENEFCITVVLRKM